MNLEDLSKSQLLLLTILVNFITSIATGIVTVSLLDEAPPTITQTVNRIVERTVETVAPQSQTASVITREKTIIVKEEDLVISAIAAQAARTVSLRVGHADANPFATGAYLPKARATVTLGSGAGAKEVVVVFPDGSSVAASLVRAEDGVELYGFSDTAKLPDVSFPALVPTRNLRAGQSVYAIAGDGSAVTGIISLVGTDKVRTNLSVVPVGSAVVNSSGDVVGLATAVAGTLLSADLISSILSATSTPASSLSL